MGFLILFLIFHILVSVALYFVFPKCGKPAVNGLIPIVNFMDWCDIIGKPRWHAFLLLIPIVNLFVFVGMTVDLGRSFGKLDFKHTAAATLFAPAFIGYLGVKDEEKYIGPNLIAEKEYQQQILDAKESGKERTYKKLVENNPYKKSAGREWFESIFFAVFAAAFIRMFLVEAYVIPTPSMEGSLNVGDFLFVSKTSYGMRMPMTVAMLPLLHNRIPILNRESYLKKPSLAYKRLPAIREIKRNSPFVFNWPVGDSVYVTAKRPYSVAQVNLEKGHAASDAELRSKMAKKAFITRPIDKKDHYIKRCVALPGDSLQIINRQIYINGSPSENPEHMQFQYKVKLPSGINTSKLKEWGLDSKYDRWQLGYFMDNKQAEQLKSLGQGVVVEHKVNQPEPGRLFPQDAKRYPGWTVDNYGPIWIPKKGETIQLTPANMSMYRRTIDVYEDNDLEVNNGNVRINGETVTSYTFKQDYYWAMGDNRHNSEDSRMWGFVPEDHIVGKPLFIWFSTKDGNIRNGINWDRIFKSAND